MCVPMLEALPPLEAEFYGHERNVVADPELRCTTIFSEIQEHFDFFGGSSDEWLKYLLRPDLPADMWIFMPPSEVKAVSGVSAFMKKMAFAKGNS